MSRWIQQFAVAVGALGSLSGCELVAGIGGEKQLDTGEAGASACPPPFPPRPPASDDDPGNIEFTAAIKVINFGEKGGVGRNIDGACSCPEAETCIGRTTRCDDDQGRDAESAQILQYFDVGLDGKYFDSQEQTRDIQNGKWSIIGTVRNWNGQPNDHQVEFSWYVSHGIQGKENGVVPQWNGTDVWTVEPGSVVNGDRTQPRNTTREAYVADGVLVSSTQVSEIEIPLSGGRVAFTLRKAVYSGRITQDPGSGGYGLTEGQISGVWRLSEVFQMVASFRRTDGSPFCTNEKPAYDIAKQMLCNNADLASDGALPTDACDSVSFGIGFDSAPAQIGNVSSRLPALAGCPEIVDPSGDSCGP